MLFLGYMRLPFFKMSSGIRREAANVGVGRGVTRGGVVRWAVGRGWGGRL